MEDTEIVVPWRLTEVIEAVAVLVLISLPGFLLSFLPYSGGRLASTNSLFTALIMVFMEGILILLAWNFGVRKYRSSFGKLGFRSFNLPSGIAKGVLWLIALKFFTVLYGVVAMSVFGLKPPDELVRGIPDIFGAGIGGFIIAIVVVSIAAPVAEETFFRGFIYPALRKRFGVGNGILIAAIIFALFHTRIWLIVPVAMMGIVLGFLYEQEKSLGPPIILHSLNNLLSLMIIYAQKG